MTDENDDAVQAEHTEEVSALPPGVPATGNPAVDRVLAEVAAVDGRPLADHVATFERAHEDLRAALDSTRG